MTYPESVGLAAVYEYRAWRQPSSKVRWATPSYYADLLESLNTEYGWLTPPLTNGLARWLRCEPRPWLRR